MLKAAAVATPSPLLSNLQVERMLQLHLACEQRIGVIIVGPSGSGKSTLWQVWRLGHRHIENIVRFHSVGRVLLHRA